MYGPRFLRDFGNTAPLVWQSAVRTLNDAQLQRGLRRLAAAGSSFAPTLPAFVKACREPGDDEGVTRPASTYLPPPNYDALHGFGQRALMQFLRIHGGTSEASLQRMVQAKAEIINAWRDTPEREREEPPVVRDMLNASFGKLWQEMPERETERHHTRVAR